MAFSLAGSSAFGIWLGFSGYQFCTFHVRGSIGVLWLAVKGFKEDDELVHHHLAQARQLFVLI